METARLYKKAEEHVGYLFNAYPSEKLFFHNINHTKEVVKRASEIAGHYELSDNDFEVVQLAAWFHDVGYLVGDVWQHEENSVKLMKEFAEEQNISQEQVDKIAACIMATRKTEEPGNLLEQIICDADSYHLGTADFKETNKQVYLEFKERNGGQLDKKQFRADTVAMLANHTYYTTYCRQLLTKNMHSNMKKLEKKTEKKVKLPKEAAADIYASDEFQTIPEITEKNGTTKGMQTMLRLTSSNHIQLSEMADNKANILISVNAIIISIIVSVLLRKLQTDPYLAIPTFSFLLFSVITMVLSILAIRPKVNDGTFDDEQVANKQTNLLFFGNFHNMSLHQYEKAMRFLMKDSDYLYSSIVQDIYYLGAVLGKKYKLIRWAYNIFMVGIVVSVLLFAFYTMRNDMADAATNVKNSTSSPF